MEYALPLSMLLCLILGIFMGYPVALLLGGLGILFTFIGDVNILFLGTTANRIFTGTLSNWLLLAVPLFVFMGLMLEKSGAARNLLLSLEQLLARRRGGLAIAVTLLGIIMAASTGIVGASVVMLGMMALPVMRQQQYNLSVACGVVCASGTLGILIPPSIMLVLVGDILQLPVGDLFMAAAMPGLMLGALYILFICGLAIFAPHTVPAGDLKDSLTGFALFWKVLADLIAPVLLIIGVLGSIVAGIATPTEAAAIGAFGSMILAFSLGQLSWFNLKETIKETTLTSSMILFVAIGASVFSIIFKRVGGENMIEDAIFAFSLGPYGTLLTIMALIFVLGFFLEWIEISYIALPLFAPIIAGLDFGFANSTQTLIWFAILVAINLQTSFLTPPFGYALFYLKGIAPPDVNMSTIYKGIIPFVLLQLTGLILALMFPQIVLWLPSMLTGTG